MREPASMVLAVVVAGGALLGTAAAASGSALAGEGYSSSYAGESVFEDRAPGQSAQLSVIFFNDGSRPWIPGIVGLLVCLPDKVTCGVPSPNAAYASGWYSNLVYATVTSEVAPGQNGFFVYSFSVPAGTPPNTTVTFNGDVGIIATDALLRPEGYYHQNTTPPVLGTLTISPTSAALAVGGQQQFSAKTELAGNVSWTVTGACGGVDSTGRFVAITTTSATQPCSVVASAGSLAASAAVTVYGNPASLSCAASTPQIVANGGVAPNGTATVTVAVRDGGGNTVATSGLGMVVTNASSGTATVTPTGQVNATNGIVTIAVASTLRTGTITVVISTADPIRACTTTLQSIPAGPPAGLVASFVPTTIGADGVSAATLRIEVRDGSGDRTLDGATVIDVQQTSGSGTCTITGTISGAGGTVSGGSSSATAVDGRIEVSVTSTVIPGSCAFTATARTPSIPASTATLTTRIVGQPVKLAVVANDSPHLVGTASTTSVTVAIQDALGTQVTTSPLPITPRLDPSTCTGAGGGDVAISSLGVTSAGQAIFQFTSNGAYGCVVRFSATGINAAQASIVFTAAGADHLGCTFTPSTIPADRASTGVALVTVLDPYGNGVNAGSYSIAFNRTAGDGVTFVAGPGTATMSDGIVVFQVRSIGTTPGADIWTPRLVTGTLLHTAPDRPCTISASR